MKYWKRHIQFIIGDTYYGDPFELSFEVDFNSRGGSGARARIYNPSEEWADTLTPSGGAYKTLCIDAGYEKDHGICFIGEIHNYELQRSGTDRILVMTLGDSSTAMAEKRVSKTWPAGVKASVIITDLVALLGLGKGVIELGSDTVYPRGVSFNDRIRRVLDQMARETSSDFFLRDGMVNYLPRIAPGIDNGIILNYETGLLGSPEMKSGKTGVADGNGGERSRPLWTVKSLFNYRVSTGDLITVESSSLNRDSGKKGKEMKSGTFRVLSGRHTYTRENAVTEMEVMEV